MNSSSSSKTMKRSQQQQRVPHKKRAIKHEPVFDENAQPDISNLLTFDYYHTNPATVAAQPHPEMLHHQLSTCKVLLFATTYNVTACGSKRVNIGLAPDRDFDVVIELENVQRLGTSVRYMWYEWDYLCGTQMAWIQRQMTCEYNPSLTPINITTLKGEANIIDMNGEAVLELKVDGSAVYIKHSSVEKINDLYNALVIAADRLNRWCPYIRAAYYDFISYLCQNNVSVNQLEQCINACIQPTSKYAIENPITVNSVGAEYTAGIPMYVIAPIGLNTIQAEFNAYRKQLFYQYCK